MKKRIVSAMLCGLLSIAMILPVFAYEVVMEEMDVVVYEPNILEEVKETDEIYQNLATDLENSLIDYDSEVLCDEQEDRGVSGAWEYDFVDSADHSKGIVILKYQEGLCVDVTNVIIPNTIDGYKVTSIGEYAFNKTSIPKSITIPEGVTSIEESAFEGCGALVSITIPNSVTSISGGAFAGCGQLTSIIIPNGVRSIEAWTFIGCSSLTSVKIPDSVTSIGAEAFTGCIKLKSITIPNSVANIERKAIGYSVDGLKIDSFIIYGAAGSVAEKYAKDNGFDFVNSLDTPTPTPTLRPTEVPTTVPVDKNEWIKDESGKWRYKHVDGTYTQNNWEQINGKWYHFDASGYMQTGWISSGSKWYYLENSGVMASSKWVGNYYLKADGSMATNEWVDNDKYYVDGSGKWVSGKKKDDGSNTSNTTSSAGWKKSAGGWWYQNANGTYPKNTWAKIDGKWYHFNGAGYMQTGWIIDGGKWYYLKSSGAMAAGEWVGNYYLKSNGVMATNEWIGKYHVDANGKWDKTK